MSIFYFILAPFNRRFRLLECRFGRRLISQSATRNTVKINYYFKVNLEKRLSGCFFISGFACRYQRVMIVWQIVADD